MASAMQTSETRVHVWDRFVRTFHWMLVAGFVAAWLTGDEWETAHIWIGYAVAALVAMRICWGFVGSRYARFSHFIRPPRVVFADAADIAAHREKRYIGHNPAGGAMVLALMMLIVVISLTGWLMTTDAFWGSELMEELHEGAVNVALVFIAVHIIGVLTASWRHHENLVRAMWTGWKRSPGPEDVDAP